MGFLSARPVPERRLDHAVRGMASAAKGLTTAARIDVFQGSATVGLVFRPPRVYL